MKLQRNALSVLEPPTGQEEDGEVDFDNSSCGSDAGEKDNCFGKFVQKKNQSVHLETLTSFNFINAYVGSHSYGVQQTKQAQGSVHKTVGSIPLNETYESKYSQRSSIKYLSVLFGKWKLLETQLFDMQHN